MEVQLRRPTPGNSQVFGGGKVDLLQANQTMMVSCKGVPGKSLTVEDGAVGFATTDDLDPNQQWIKVGDPANTPAFALVNLGSPDGMALQIPTAAKLPVRLAPYNPNDKTQLWTAKKGDGGYSIICESVNNHLVLDAVHKGLQVVVSNCSGGDSQLWVIERAKERKA